MEDKTSGIDMDLPLPNCLLCGNPFDPEQFMIQCDVCRMWYHGQCTQLKEYMATELDVFHCPRCKEKHGPSTIKIKKNWHRHDYTEVDADGKPVQTGTPVFIRELKSRHFPRADDIIKRLKGQQLTMQYLQTNGFDMPIIVDSKDGLDIVVPPPNFSLQDIANYVGGDREMDVIDVAKQNNVRMSMNEFVEYFNDPCRSRILNVISLEFTNTGLSPLVEAPYIARKLDWVNYVWPRDLPDDSELKKPEVQKYCLMSVKDSFTDFHIDFGGTSVWYHVLRGEKIFYLIKPTPANLHLYQQWMCSSTQSETFFGDQVDACYKCIVKQGQTMLIPTGWIHAVLTPVDSLVFGGNFIHSLNIPMQIQIYEMERKMKTPAKFQYPSFETINWFAAKRLLKELKDLNIEEKKCPNYLLMGLKALLSILKQWNTDKDYNMISRAQIPGIINSQKLLKDLSKEVRHAERFLLALNPPKPERESKRKKKKPVNKDFVDFKTADRNIESSKIKSPSKESAAKTEKTVVSQPVPNVPTLKLTLPKPIVHSMEKCNSRNEQLPIPNIQTPVKTIKTLSPKVPKAKKSSSTKNSNIKLPKVNKNSPKKSPSRKKLSGEAKNSSKHLQNPSVIRFKLGDKEVVRSTKEKGNDIYGNFTLDHAVETRKELTWKQTTSVYDFHDGSNESDYGGFTIDEAPKRKKSQKQSNSPKKVKRYEPEVEVSSTPKNGIEELLKASVYTLAAGTPRLDPVIPSVNANFVPPSPVSTGASPSTQDAIAGMLSFSAQCYSNTPEVPPVKQIKVLKPKPIVEHDDEDDLLIENMDKVHQDDDFIYPALDVSDEDEFMFKPKAKREEDEAWNPKARVGPLLPKTNRPPREGVKKTSVEKGLEAAAKKRLKQPGSSKRSYKKKRKDSLTSPVTSTATGTGTTVPAPILGAPALTSIANMSPTGSTSFDAIDSVSKQSSPYSSILTSPNRLKDVKAKLAAPVPVERKPKKGLKTAKQRLGKILKIHRMWH